MQQSGGDKKEKERGKGRNENLPNRNQIIAEISLTTLTTTAVIFYEEGADEGVFTGESQGCSQSWVSYEFFPTDFL